MEISSIRETVAKKLSSFEELVKCQKSTAFQNNATSRYLIVTEYLMAGCLDTILYWNDNMKI